MLRGFKILAGDSELLRSVQSLFWHLQFLAPFSGFPSRSNLLTVWCLRLHRIVKPSIVFFAVISLHDPFLENGGEMAGPMAHHMGCKRRRPFGYDPIPAGEEPNDGFSRSPSQRHRSQFRLQSPVANLDRSRNATETPASTACDLFGMITQIIKSFWHAALDSVAHRHPI